MVGNYNDRRPNIHCITTENKIKEIKLKWRRNFKYYVGCSKCSSFSTTAPESALELTRFAIKLTCATEMRSSLVYCTRAVLDRAMQNLKQKRKKRNKY
jgi:hypothetical protein